MAVTPEEFIAGLHAERDAMRAFIELLESEQRCLLASETEQLLTLAESKNQIAGRLHELGSARKQFQSQNIASEPLESWLKSHAGTALPVWEEIRTLADRAQQINNSNGEMIKTKLRYNQQALNVLHSAAQNASLYGPDGQPNLPGSGRRLGSV